LIGDGAVGYGDDKFLYAVNVAICSYLQQFGSNFEFIVHVIFLLEAITDHHPWAVSCPGVDCSVRYSTVTISCMKSLFSAIGNRTLAFGYRPNLLPRQTMLPVRSTHPIATAGLLVTAVGLHRF